MDVLLVDDLLPVLHIEVLHDLLDSLHELVLR